MNFYFISIFAIVFTIIPISNDNHNHKNNFDTMIYHVNDPRFHENSGLINDSINESEEIMTIEQLSYDNDASSLDFTIPTIPPITPPITPPVTPFPSIYYGGLKVPYYNQIEFSKNYYENLNANFPTNEIGNCGYVAISMLLQYYDLYWNNNFIPNTFNNNDLCQIDSLSDTLFESPGTSDIYLPLWTEDNPYVDESDPDYATKIAAARRTHIINMMSNNSFIGYLYSIGVELGYIDLNSINVGTGVSHEIVLEVLSNFIDNNTNINNYVSVHSYHISNFNYNQTDIRNAIIEIVSEGQPVIVGGGIGSYGHDVVAYYYDQENDILYGHTGWKNDANLHNNSFKNLDDLFTEYGDFFYIDVATGLNHTHNKKFQLQLNNTTTTYCSCSLDSHVCNFYDFPYNDDNYHIHQCLCGFEYELHDFIWISNDTKQCSNCRVMFSNPSVQN